MSDAFHPTDDQPVRTVTRCPCCELKTVERRREFEICPVCYWEDDGQDDVDADVVRGGPNGELSLTAARANYARCGACCERHVRDVRRPNLEELG